MLNDWNFAPLNLEKTCSPETQKNESKYEEQLKILKNLVMNTGKSQSTKIGLAMHMHNEVFGTGYRCKVESSECKDAKS